MIFSLAVGIALIAVGIYRRNKSIWYKISIIVGIALVLYAIYLGFPK
ncbi:exosortase [Amylolactobacillus amylophilus DSM 20533 = JCM 1125]|uniref:Exosortase n=2 Tax=Amylolactobacillus amylophilus TaxID=1603 RepID=A0A1L6XED8_9LACO|nr:exosortase [Amylolactobacillus amylophilus DSM 20533 = JCM 1125]